jgi:hypothetical protein
MAQLTKSAEQVPGLRDLIEAWCDRRCLIALKYVLPAYVSFNGRIDGWSMLCAAVRNARTFAHDELTEGDLETICLIIRSAKESFTVRLPRQGDRLKDVHTPERVSSSRTS